MSKPPHILKTRIDNRLIHGQIAVSWTNHLGANLILVANDDAANNEVQQDLMDMAAPEGAETRYFTIEETINKIHKAADHQKIFMVVKNPQDILKLVEGGVPIEEVNVGNMHYEEGKEKLTNTVSVSEEEKEAFRKLNEKGIKLEAKQVPDKKGKDIMELI